MGVCMHITVSESDSTPSEVNLSFTIDFPQQWTNGLTEYAKKHTIIKKKKNLNPKIAHTTYFNITEREVSGETF